MGVALWKHLSGNKLLTFINVFSGVAMFFEGYNQGVMGGVNTVAQYIDTVGIGANGVVTDTTKQGGYLPVIVRSDIQNHFRLLLGSSGRMFHWRMAR